MREPYRWMALSLVALWMLLLIFLAKTQENPRHHNRRTVFLLLVLSIANLPHVRSIWPAYLHYRHNFYRINQMLLPLSSDLAKGNRVAFLPYRNDFLMNYLSASLQIHAYNIGGDKNLAEAYRYWPSIMQRFSPNYVDPFFAYRVLLLLATKQADAVVLLPYTAMLWARRTGGPLLLSEALLSL